MPIADTKPDWSGIRAAAVSVGIREACRQATDHLPEDEARRFTERAMKRCSREGWLSAAMSAKQQAVRNSRQALSANVRTGAEIVQSTLKNNFDRSRLNMSEYLVEASQEALAEPSKLAVSAQVANLASIQSKLDPVKEDHGMRLSLFNVTGDMTVIENG